MSVLAVIPARSGSTRLVDKNLRKLGGDTLVQLAVNAARDGSCDRVVVSTNRPEMAGDCEWVLRPDEISGPTADISQALQHALSVCESTGTHYEWIITLQPTLPCRPAGMIDRMLQAVIDEKAMSAITAAPVVPWMWRCSHNNTAANEWHPGPYPRSQDFEKQGQWMAEINCITITHHSVIRGARRWALPLLLCALPEWANVDIDNEHDLADAQHRWPALSEWMSTRLTNLDYQRIDEINSLQIVTELPTARAMTPNKPIL